MSDTEMLAKAASPQSKQATILIVDDDLVFRSTMAKQLPSHGYEVNTASNGKEALKIFGSKQVDIVILDVKMPELDGFGVCEEIKSHTDTPIIFVTGAQDGIIQQHMSKLSSAVGADRYVTKPVDIKVLINLVEEVVAKQ